MQLNLMKEEFSKAYVNALAAVTGCNISLTHQDIDSIDMTLRASRSGAPIEKVSVDIQLKCTSCDAAPSDADLTFSLPVKNYNDLRKNSSSPHLLVVVFVPQSPLHWTDINDENTTLYYAAYWLNLKNPQLPDTTNINTINVQIPSGNLLTVDALNRIIDAASKGEEP